MPGRVKKNAPPPPPDSAVTVTPAPAAVPPAAARSKTSGLLAGLHGDVARSGFLMTILTIVALVVSALSLWETARQTNAPPIVIPVPFQAAPALQPHVIEPVYRVPDSDGTGNGFPGCPVPSTVPAVTVRSTTA